MTKLHDFLAEHAKFPFPATVEDFTAETTDISPIEVGLLYTEWKAKYAIRDNTLVQKLCSNLENILGDTLLEPSFEEHLLSVFSPQLEKGKFGRNSQWLKNDNEAKASLNSSQNCGSDLGVGTDFQQSRTLLNLGVHETMRGCLFVYGDYEYTTELEHRASGAHSKVDYVIMVDGDEKVLCEAKSPSLMKKAGDQLPPHGFEFKWVRGQPLVPKLLMKAALCMGLRKREWLFLSCHNYWVVCRLVRDDRDPFLAYSPMISIKDSSEPFRALLGATLSVIKGVPVGPSVFRQDMTLDIIPEDEDEDPTSKDGIDDADSGLMITSSSPNSPESFQLWVHLRTFSNNKLALPVSNKNGKQRLWITHFLGFGSTGSVWKCRFDNNEDSFAIKIAELLHPSDTESRLRLRNEFNMYLTLERAYKTGKLHNRITPRCYGAFEGNGINVLILDLCDNGLDSWDQLNDSERCQVFKLVQNLHNIGIAHGDLEPRNIMRTFEGGFCLIDFSESRKHRCPDKKLGQLPTPPNSAIIENWSCYELWGLRDSLWKQDLFNHPGQL